MNDRILLSLVTLPTLAGSILTMTLLASQVSATETKPINDSATPPVSCDLTIPSRLESSLIHRLNKGVLLASSTNIVDEYPMLDFSDAESDAAVTLFGCDCSSCINALRQLRAQPLLNTGQGHCWSSLQQQISPQDIQQVLKTLEAEEAN
jgi:hypothetical protein